MDFSCLERICGSFIVVSHLWTEYHASTPRMRVEPLHKRSGAVPEGSRQSLVAALAIRRHLWAGLREVNSGIDFSSNRLALAPAALLLLGGAVQSGCAVGLELLPEFSHPSAVTLSVDVVFLVCRRHSCRIKEETRRLMRPE